MSLILRAYYSPDVNQRAADDAKIDEWVSASHYLEEGMGWAYLDDPELFDFNADWQRVSELMPEVAGPMNRGGRLKKEPITLGLPQFKDALRRLKQMYPDEWKEDRQRYIENITTGLQRQVTAAYLLVADEKAFQTDHLPLLYVDYKLNVIRESRVEADETSITDVVID